MDIEPFIGISVVCAVGLGIYGLARRFPLFIVRGALINGVGFIFSVWAVLTGMIYGYSRNGAWWLLAVAGLVFAYVCGTNIRHFLNGSEAESFYRLVRSKMGSSED